MKPVDSFKQTVDEFHTWEKEKTTLTLAVIKKFIEDEHEDILTLCYFVSGDFYDDFEQSFNKED